MPVSRKALEAHTSKPKKDTDALLQEILEQQKQILAALEKLAK